jgi:dephospho-CoA kinase
MSDIKPKVMVVGVTGGIACGKSEVGRILQKVGFAVCDADLVAHALMTKGNLPYHQIVDHFGESILTEAGEISRPILGNIIFKNPGEREELNRLIHPAVREALMKWISEVRSEERCAAVLIPLLYESGMQTLDFDGVICVSSSDDAVFQRLEKRGLNREEAENRIRSQMPLAEKEKRADYVIPNIGTLGELDEVVRETVRTLSS